MVDEAGVRTRLPSSHCILSFGGIANKCTIWLNGKLLGTHEGMFGGPDFSIGNYLKNKNTLIVKLEAIPQMFLGNWLPTQMKVGNIQLYSIAFMDGIMHKSHH